MSGDDGHTISGIFNIHDLAETTKMINVTPVLRWSAAGTLQQEWETWELTDGFARSRTTEWRDVPVEA